MLFRTHGRRRPSFLHPHDAAAVYVPVHRNLTVAMALRRDPFTRRITFKFAHHLVSQKVFVPHCLSSHYSVRKPVLSCATTLPLRRSTHCIRRTRSARDLSKYLSLKVSITGSVRGTLDNFFLGWLQVHSNVYH
jgi:hypothetical protein